MQKQYGLPGSFAQGVPRPMIRPWRLVMSYWMKAKVKRLDPPKALKRHSKALLGACRCLSLYLSLSPSCSFALESRLLTPNSALGLLGWLSWLQPNFHCHWGQSSAVVLSCNVCHRGTIFAHGTLSFLLVFPTTHTQTDTDTTKTHTHARTPTQTYKTILLFAKNKKNKDFLNNFINEKRSRIRF